MRGCAGLCSGGCAGLCGAVRGCDLVDEVDLALGGVHVDVEVRRRQPE